MHARRAVNKKLTSCLIQSRSQSLSVQERHRQARLTGGADPRIEHADYARMLHRSQRGHLMRETVAHPALFARTPVEHLHGKTGGAITQIARFVDHVIRQNEPLPVTYGCDTANSWGVVGARGHVTVCATPVAGDSIVSPT